MSETTLGFDNDSVHDALADSKPIEVPKTIENDFFS